MTDRFAECLPQILKYEGGYVDDPKDPGGATNYGITIGTLSAWLGRPATKADVAALTQATAAPIYSANYWMAAKCDRLPVGLDLLVFDTAVNMGVSRAAKFLQAALGVAVDGQIGPKTLTALAEADQSKLIHSYVDQREAFYHGLSTFGRFGKGWMSRLDDVEARALEMAP